MASPRSSSSSVGALLDSLLSKWYVCASVTLALWFPWLKVIFCSIRPPAQTHDDESSSPPDIEQGIVAPTDLTDDESSSSQDTEEDGIVPIDPPVLIQVESCKFEDAGGVADTCCTICLEDFMADDYVIGPYDCKHIFHIDCVDRWINRGFPQSFCCPNCRSIVCIKEENIVRD